jgi:hypothetical protein
MTEGQLSVWWIPQIPAEPFRVLVKDVEQGCFLLRALAYYDMFQLENRIKPDYANMGGLDVWEDGEWVTYYDDEGRDDDEIMADQEAKPDFTHPVLWRPSQ